MKINPCCEEVSLQNCEYGNICLFVMLQQLPSIIIIIIPTPTTTIIIMIRGRNFGKMDIEEQGKY